MRQEKKIATSTYISLYIKTKQILNEHFHLITFFCLQTILQLIFVFNIITVRKLNDDRAFTFVGGADIV